MFKAKHFFGISVFATFLSSCGQLPPEYEEALLVQHFEKNQAAFKALEQTLLDDPGVISVIACPTEKECFIRPEEPTDEQLIYEKKYVPILRALGFIGPIFFNRKSNGSFEFPNTSIARKGPYGLVASLWLRPNQPSTLPSCGDYSPNTYSYGCQVDLDGDWTIVWEGLNDDILSVCVEKKLDQRCDIPFSEDSFTDPCFDRCIAEEEAKLRSGQP